MIKINYYKAGAFITSLGVLMLFPLISIYAISASPTIVNPLGGTNPDSALQDFFKKVLQLVMTAGTIIFVFFIIYSGYKFVTAGSSDTDRTDAKKIFYATIIGGAILLGADLIATAVIDTVDSLH